MVELLENLRQLEEFCATHDNVQLCRNYIDYQEAKAHNRHTQFFHRFKEPNAISGAPNGVASLPENHGVIRMTLVPLTPSVYGNTSSPGHLLHTHKGLTPVGRTLVEEMNHHKIMVDLAHIHPDGFLGCRRCT